MNNTITSMFTMNDPKIYGIITLGVGAFLALLTFALNILSNYLRPDVLTKILTRRKYINKIISICNDENIYSMCAFLPTMTSSKTENKIVNIQQAWLKLANRGDVKIITTAEPESLEVALELYELGIDVRIISHSDLSLSSFHIFTGNNKKESVVNHKSHYEKKASVSFYKKSCITVALDEYFNRMLLESISVPSFFTAYIFKNKNINDAYIDCISNFDISNRIQEIIKYRLRILHKLHFVLILGRAGSGKTSLRKEIEKEMRKQEINFVSLSDYPFLYTRYLENILDDGTEKKFVPREHRGFQVLDTNELLKSERYLLDYALSQANDDKCVILEMGCADNKKLLESISPIILKSMLIIHISTPAEIAKKRLKKRWVLPSIDVNGYNISIELSDMHYLSEEAFDLLYLNDTSITDAPCRVIELDNSNEENIPFNNVLQKLLSD